MEKLQYETNILTSKAEVSSVTEAWERFRMQQGRPHVHQHPDWLSIEIAARDKPGLAPLVVTLHFKGERVGVAPFLLRRWNWPCRFGYWSVARFPVRMAALCGEGFMAPLDLLAQEAVLRALASARSPVQVVFLESLPVESPLWEAIRTSPEVARNFWVYSPAGITPRRRIRLPDSFDAYLAGFSSDSRNKMRRWAKKLDEACRGGVRLKCVSRREQVPEFLEQVERLSAMSWQGRRLGQVVRGTDQVEKLCAYADRGWLRCYLLYCGEQPVSFEIGLQADETYHLLQTGYDPDWAKYRPGNVLIYHYLQHLYAENTPEWVDFGCGENEYKRFWGNACHDEANVYLIRKSAYTGLAYAVNKACATGGAKVRETLDRLQMREKARRVLRDGTYAPAKKPVY